MTELPGQCSADRKGISNKERDALRQKRQQIDRLLDRFDFDGVGKLPGFRIIDRAENRPPVEDCSVYVFGKI